MNLRIDPWDPEYGASVEIEPDLGPPVGLDLDVEVEGLWQPISALPRDLLPCCAFVDGVRRIDARLFAEEDGAEAPALAGSWAVGCARSTRPPIVGDVLVGREIVLGGGLGGTDLNVRIGDGAVTFTARSVPGVMPLDPLRGLQNAMRDAEAELAEDVLRSGEVDLVISDGPLSYFSAGPALGMVKRQSRSYLDPPRAHVLARLGVGQRSPIFKLGEQRLERYTWYLRLAGQRPIDGTMAGIVRLEVAAAGGLQAAQQFADFAGAILPRFAPTLGRDPRAPQNLFPISALESALRHRLGDPALVRRALEARIYMEVLHAG